MDIFGPKAPKVLIAEDDPTTRALLENMLIAEKLNVHVAEDGLEAWEKIQAEGFQLVVLDHHMPGLDGLQVLKAMREVRATRHIPALILTADTSTGLMADAYDLKITEFIHKPCDVREFVVKVKIALENAKK